MGKKVTILGIVFISVSLILFAEDKAAYGTKAQTNFEILYYNQHKGDEALKILDDWLKVDNTNPELYIDYFNYYLGKGRKSGIAFDSAPGTKGASIQLADPKTNKVIGYMHDSTSYDAEQIQQALHYLNLGLMYSVDRLDMYFGKIHILNEIGDYDTASKTVFDVLDRSKINGNEWYWSKNKKLEDGKNFLLQNMNDYYAKWIHIRTKESIKALKETSEKQIELYPDSIFAYNFLAYSYILKNEKVKAIPILLKAEKINPSDFIILNNLERLYADTGDKQNAIIYLNKMISIGDEKQKTMAKKKLQELQ